MKKFKRIYVDMDGVVADFDKGAKETGKHPKEFKLIKGVYRNLHPIAGAIEALTKLRDKGYDIEIATKLPHENPYAATEKLLWIGDHMPWLIGHVTITSDKGQLGDKEDALIDDRMHKANAENFAGCLIHFGTETFPDWESVLKYILEDDF